MNNAQPKSNCTMGICINTTIVGKCIYVGLLFTLNIVTLILITPFV